MSDGGSRAGGGLMVRTACLLVLLNLLAVATGCSLRARKTATPAAHLGVAELAQMPPTPGQRFYLLLFGSHDLLRRPANTHTWATLVKAIDQPGCAEPVLEVHTIS